MNAIFTPVKRNHKIEISVKISDFAGESRAQLTPASQKGSESRHEVKIISSSFVRSRFPTTT